MILWIVLFVLSFLVIVSASLAAYDPTATDPSQIEMDAGEYRNLTLVSSILTIASTIAWCLALVFFALELIPPEKKMLLWGGMGLRVAASIIVVAILMAVLPTSGTVNLNEADVQTGYADATAIIDLIGVALFFVAYRAAREGILTGKVMPVGMPPAQPPPSGPPPQWGQQWPPSQPEEPPKWEEPDTTSEEEVIRPS